MNDYAAFIDLSVSKRIKHEESAKDEKSSDKGGRKDLFLYLCHTKNLETGPPASNRHQLEARASLLVVAGTDTTAATISGLFLYLTHTPHVPIKNQHPKSAPPSQRPQKSRLVQKYLLVLISVLASTKQYACHLPDQANSLAKSWLVVSNSAISSTRKECSLVMRDGRYYIVMSVWRFLGLSS